MPEAADTRHSNKKGGDKFIAEYASVKEACIALGKNPRSPLISYACRGKCTSNNVNTAYGYKWSYAE